jgi:hypothetical protein
MAILKHDESKAFYAITSDAEGKRLRILKRYTDKTHNTDETGKRSRYVQTVYDKIID